MLERITRCFLLVAMAAAPLTGCSYMTAQGRQQMAYQHYIRKCSGRRAQVNKKIKAPKMPRTPGPSGNRVNTETVQGPQSVTSGESQTSE